MPRHALPLALLPAVLVMANVTLGGCRPPGAPRPTDSRPRPAASVGATRAAAAVVRLSGTVEAVRASTIVVPRLAGQNTNSLVITRLVPAGTAVKPGDL